MNSLALLLVFLTAVVVSGSVVMLFSKPIDLALNYILSAELAAACSKYAKFAVFVTAFAGGLRLSQIDFLSFPQAPINANRCLIEVFRSITGTLEGAKESLLIFFGGILAIHAGVQLYAYVKELRNGRLGDFARHPAQR